MKRYIINTINNSSPMIDQPTDVLELKRNNNGANNGLLLNGIHYEISDWSLRTLPADYNNHAFYIYNREVSGISGSTDENTLITNDGIIAVIRGINYIEFVDLFDQDSDIYEDIDPNGYEQLSGYDETVNPINKRVLTVYDKNSDNVMWTKNKLQFIINGEYHFNSEFDYDLPLDDYGYYITDLTDWTNLYSETSNFQFYKKTYFKIEGSDTITVALLNNEEVVVKEELGNIRTLKFLSIAEGDKFVNFQISFATENNGYIIIN
jgi:hypothetical protein